MWLYNSRIVRYIALLLGLFLVNFCIFIQFSAYKDTDNGWDAWSNDETYSFMAFDRIAVTTGLSLIFLPVLFGQFSLIAEFLCSSIWTPFARLNFSCYLIHYSIIVIFYHNKHVSIHYSAWNSWSDFLVIAAVSYAAALIVCLMVESSSMALEKLLLRRETAPVPKIAKESSK